MVQLGSPKPEVKCRIVYEGPGLAGKSSNLEAVYHELSSHMRNKPSALMASTDRSLVFETRLEGCERVAGMATSFQLRTIPGLFDDQWSKKTLLSGVDGIVFVADSQRCRRDENLESLALLRQNLSELGQDLTKIPLVFQWNKRELSEIMSVAELDSLLNPDRLPAFEAVASKGLGAMTTLRTVAELVVARLNREYQELESKKPSITYTLSPCDQSWGSLIETSNQRARFCDHCQREVHIVENQKELARHSAAGHCIALKNTRIGTGARLFLKGGGPDSNPELPCLIEHDIPE